MNKDKQYDISDFTKYDDEAFVDNAYDLILSRKPDTDGKNHFINNLRQGIISKIEIIDELRFSEEGKKENIKITNMEVVPSSAMKRIDALESKVKDLSALIDSFAEQVNQNTILLEDAIRELASALEQKADNEDIKMLYDAFRKLENFEAL